MAEEETRINTITIYENWVTVAKSLKPADQGAFFMAICNYALNKEVKPLKPSLQAIFDMAKPVIDKSQSRKKAQIAGLQKRKKQQVVNLQNGLQNDLQNGLQNDFCKVHYNKDKDKDKYKDEDKDKDKRDANTLSTTTTTQKYPESILEVLAIAESVGVLLENNQAEKYLHSRQALGWRKYNEAIKSVGSDLKMWLLSYAQKEADRQKLQPKKRHLEASEEGAYERDKEYTGGF